MHVSVLKKLHKHLHFQQGAASTKHLDLRNFSAPVSSCVVGENGLGLYIDYKKLWNHDQPQRILLALT